MILVYWDLRNDTELSSLDFLFCLIYPRLGPEEVTTQQTKGLTSEDPRKACSIVKRPGKEKPRRQNTFRKHCSTYPHHSSCLRLDGESRLLPLKSCVEVTLSAGWYQRRLGEQVGFSSCWVMKTCSSCWGGVRGNLVGIQEFHHHSVLIRPRRV